MRGYHQARRISYGGKSGNWQERVFHRKARAKKMRDCQLRR